jgi:hypothetical protein
MGSTPGEERASNGIRTTQIGLRMGRKVDLHHSKQQSVAGGENVKE